MPSNLSSKPNRERSVAVIIPLLLFQLVLLSFQKQNPAGMTPVKTVMLAVQTPIVGVVSAITDTVADVWHNYVWLVNANDENEKLRESVRDLELLNRSYEEIRQENVRLQQLLAIEVPPGYRTVGARVIARTPTFLSNVLYVDRGSKDGIQIDSPVLSGDGIIGRAVQVEWSQSQVQLITNPDASIGVMMKGTRTPGVLRGTGGPLMDLLYISNAERIQVGDTVLSSGLDAIFPKGFVVGNVIESWKSQGVFYQIKVEPAVDLYHIEEVLVLLMEP